MGFLLVRLLIVSIPQLRKGWYNDFRFLEGGSTGPAGSILGRLRRWELIEDPETSAVISESGSSSMAGSLITLGSGGAVAKGSNCAIQTSRGVESSSSPERVSMGGGKSSRRRSSIFVRAGGMISRLPHAFYICVLCALSGLRLNGSETPNSKEQLPQLLIGWSAPPK
jgi:hypothetical protein